MHKIQTTLLLVAIWSLGSGCVPAGLNLTTEECKFLNLVSPEITVRCLGQKDYYEGVGTGVVVANGIEYNNTGTRIYVSYILTAKHVVMAEDGYILDYILVKVPDYLLTQKVGYRTQLARIVNVSRTQDLALIAVESDTYPFTSRITELHDADTATDADVYACGSFEGGTGTLSVGKRLPGNIIIRWKFLDYMSTTYAGPGASGGGFFARDPEGRLRCVGVITNKIDEVGVAGYSASVIKEFLESSFHNPP